MHNIAQQFTTDFILNAFFAVLFLFAYIIYDWWKGTHEEILDFVEKKFHAKDKFTWFEKGHVNGKETREVYSFLKNTLPSEDGTAVSIYTTCAWMPSLVTYHLWYIQMFLVCVINTYDDTLMVLYTYLGYTMEFRQISGRRGGRTLQEIWSKDQS